MPTRRIRASGALRFELGVLGCLVGVGGAFTALALGVQHAWILGAILIVGWLGLPFWLERRVVRAAVSRPAEAPTPWWVAHWTVDLDLRGERAARQFERDTADNPTLR
ncbi:MAG: hypothetical protein NXI31_15680 [bacterium]|nr:hypothetical protein [bacterium]